MSKEQVVKRRKKRKKETTIVVVTQIFEYNILNDIVIFESVV